MVGADDAVCVDFWVVGCCGVDCFCWAEVEVLRWKAILGIVILVF